MAHRVKVRVVPHRNKDGSLSKSSKDYQVWDKTRRGRVLVGVCKSQRAADDMVIQYRAKVFHDHLTNHPNDIAFVNKHFGSPSVAKEEEAA